MTDYKNTAGTFIALCLFPLVMAACGGEPAISFSQDVQPILNQHCIKCHQAGGQGEVASGLNMETYESLMKGTHAGPMIIAGDIEGSNMLVLMEGRADPSIRMPHGQNQPVSNSDIQTIRLWIGQGAKDN